MGLGIRGISAPVGTVLLLIIVVILAVLLAGLGFGVAEESKPNVHGQASFEFNIKDPGEEYLMVYPKAVESRGSTFVMSINGNEVKRWDGTGRTRVKCLYPGDKVQIHTEEPGTTDLIGKRTFEDALDCPLTAFQDKFTYAIVDGKQHKINDQKLFGLALDPDGPGSDSRTHKFLNDDIDRIGPIPLTNPWHYKKKFPDQKIEGLEPPVWLFIMTDNVHWNNAPGVNPNLNWTDDPPVEIGKNAYVKNGQDIVAKPSGSEPTNDLYVVFKPGCEQSKIKVLKETAGYDNQLLLNGNVAIENTNDVEKETILNAPGLQCGG